MVSYTTFLLAVTCLSTVNASPRLRKRELSFDYNNEKVRGVNLGGWFVLEPWITPGIFTSLPGDLPGRDDVVDEYTYSQKLGKSETANRLKSHWNTWITEDDFQEIARAGLNHVRIPIGYWAVAPRDEDPYIQGQLEYLDRAITWARNAKLKVMIDLHGAPGSQNGFDNSGKRGDINWISSGGASGALDAIQALANRYAQETDVVTAIELLNEPANWGNDMGSVKKFYYDGWGNVRKVNGDTAVVFSDAFLDTKDYWNGFMGPGSGINNVMIDTHIYSIFSDGEVGRSPCEHISVACSKGPKLASVDKWVIVGEWTAAQTDCARWLNGLGKGARYDQTFQNENYHGSCDGKYEGTVAGLSQADKTNIEYYVEAQLDAFEQGDGWVFWTWKTESAPEWNLRDLIREGLFPQPLTARKHPGQCQTGCQMPSK